LRLRRRLLLLRLRRRRRAEKRRGGDRPRHGLGSVGARVRGRACAALEEGEAAGNAAQRRRRSLDGLGAAGV
jgi:hypothetical protein